MELSHVPPDRWSIHDEQVDVGNGIGKEADVILLRTDKPNVFPINDPIGAVVWGMDTSNVDTVFVSGKAMKRNGESLHVDWTAVKKTVTESRDYVMKKSGFKLPPIQTKTLLHKFESYKDEDTVKQLHCQAISAKSPYLDEQIIKENEKSPPQADGVSVR